MSNITEPITVGPMICNKTQTGFSVMFAMRRPVAWRNIGSTLNSPGTWIPWTPKIWLYDHQSGQSWNSNNQSRYSGHPLLKNFNFRFTIIK